MGGPSSGLSTLVTLSGERPVDALTERLSLPISSEVGSNEAV